LFVDEVYRIVPKGVPLDDSDELKNLMEKCDDAVRTIAPESYVEASKPYAQAFGRALDQPDFLKIAETEYGIEKSEDWELLHPKKVGISLEYELSIRSMQRLAPRKPGWVMVPRGVSGLILSILANDIAESKGFDAITD
jgi:hypothetical protein